MNTNSWILLSLVATLAGCSSASNYLPTLGRHSGKRESVHEFMERKSHHESSSDYARWDWATGIPVDAVRAEVVKPIVPNQAVSLLFPNLKEADVQLASATSGTAVRVDEIDGKSTKNFRDLHSAIKSVSLENNSVKVILSDGRETTVDAKTLPSIEQGVAREQQFIRVVDDGNPRIIVRDNGVHCTLLPRVERGRGLLHVVVSTRQCWGEERQLPREVRAWCDGKPLRVLTAAQVLEHLYATDGATPDEPVHADEASFASVSAGHSYSIPTNYQKLQQDYDQLIRRTSFRPQPALASLPGVVYPGSPVLGDARALSAFLLRPQIYESNAKERTGWIMFAGDSMNDGGMVEIELHLTDDPIRCRFEVPAI